MNIPPKGTHLVTCRCLHCEGGIEFDASQLENDEIREIECPHCHLETLVFAPEPLPSIQATVVWLKTILRRAARKMGIQVDEHAVELIASCSLRAPMDTIRHLKIVADFANTRQSSITADVAAMALQEFVQTEQEEEAKKEAAVAFERFVDRQTTPPTFQDFIGQKRIKERILFAVEASKNNNQPLGHALFVGAPGSGKTTLAFLLSGFIAHATNTTVKAVNGSAVKYAGDLAGILTNLEENDMLFVDNIDLLPKDISEYLEPALADFKLDIIIDQGENARSVRLNLPCFILIATATNKKRLSPMLQACFTIEEEMDGYSDTELANIVRFFAKCFALEIGEAATDLIVRSAGNTPKNVLNLMRHIRVFAKVKKSSQQISTEIVTEALKLLPALEQTRESNGRQGIPSEVRREVWRRDSGKCVKCGSRENLEYDHIIPIAKGGSNTTRNIELLCEVCNRAKSDLIQ